MSKKWQHNPKWNGPFSWVNTSFLLATPLLALVALPWYLLSHGLGWFEFAMFATMTSLTGFGITVGYHRMISHQSCESTPFVRFLFLVFGAGALQNSALKWCSDHRYHHRFVDKEGDPYNRNRGFFYSHIGWIFYDDPAERNYENAHDLLNDPLVMWQHRWYLPLGFGFGFVVPTLVGWAFGHALAGFLFGGLFRMLFVHHGTFLINSAAHTFGTRPYNTKNSARDCWWLAFFTNGEGFHNFHHAFANDYRNGLRWYQWDPSKWMIWSLSKTGGVYGLHRTPEAHILKARMEASVDQFRKTSQQAELPDQLESMRRVLEEKLQEFQVKLREFQTWKETGAQPRWARVQARYWTRRLRKERQLLEAHVEEFRAHLRIVMAHGLTPVPVSL